MSFPKSLNKKVSGNLKITVRPPGVSLEKTAQEYIPSVPAGFSFNGSLKEQVSQSIKNANDRMKEIQQRSIDCKSCDSVEQEVETCSKILESISYIGNLADNRFHLVLGQDEDGSITIKVDYSNRQTYIIVDDERFSCGFYEDDLLVNTCTLEEVQSVNKIVMFLMGMDI